jgi:RNA polymerase sigma-70 factor (ECF subfamily)
MLALHGSEPGRGALMGVRTSAASDDDAAFARFFRDQFAAVTRAVYLICHDRQVAEDVAQDAFTQLHVHWRKVSGYERPEAWVRRVAVRIAIRTTQRDERRRHLHRAVEPQTVRDGRDPDLMEALKRLPPRQRAAIALHYLEDRPVDEVASILGCAPSTARVHLHKARQRLAEMLRETVDEVPDVP